MNEARVPARRKSPTLPPAELAARLDRFLAAGERLIAPVPAGQMDSKPGGGDSTVRDLGYRLFRQGLGFADAMDRGGLPEEWFEAKAPPDLRDGAAIARYGALVRGRLSGWFEGAAPGEYSRVIDACGGRQSGRDLLERTAGRVASHLRRLHAALEELGLSPGEPLPAADFEDLPLPAALC